MAEMVDFKIGNRMITVRKPERGSLVCRPFPNNFGIVIADKLYRGAFPNQKNLAALKKIGVEKIITVYSDCELSEVQRLTAIVSKQGMKHSMFEITGLDSFKQVARRIVSSKQAVYIHCKSGSNRTGKVIALVRIYLGQANIENLLIEALCYGFDYHKKYRGDLERLLTEAWEDKLFYLPNSEKERKLTKNDQ